MKLEEKIENGLKVKMVKNQKNNIMKKILKK